MTTLRWKRPEYSNEKGAFCFIEPIVAGAPLTSFSCTMVLLGAVEDPVKRTAKNRVKHRKAGIPGKPMRVNALVYLWPAQARLLPVR